MSDDGPPPEAPEPPETSAPAAPTPEPSEKSTEDWETRFEYLLADFENFRKRSERDRESAKRFGRALVLRSLLPLWEAFEKADEASRRLPSKDPLRAGLDLVRKEWEQLFKSEHVEPVARIGEPFRSEDHEAVAETPPTGELREGGIAEIVQQGYRSDDGLLRPAKVVVARKPPKPSGAHATAEEARD